MVKSMTPEEYARLFGPKPVVDGNGSNGTLGSTPPVPLLEEAEPPQADTDITDEEVAQLEEATLAGYKHKFIKEDWQTIDNIHLLRHHDKRVAEGVAVPGVANFSEMGCISGDEKIRVLTAGGQVRDWTLRDAYKGFNRICDNKAENWKSSKPYKTLALNGLGRISHEEILAITYSGRKRCLKLTLEDGRSITLTPDHQVLAYNPDAEGTDLEEIWTEAQYITIGQTIRVKGRKGEKHDSKRSAYKYVRVPEKAGHGAGLTRDYFREHRIVADTPDDMDTHHIDETSNNDPMNLRVVTRSEHSRTHARGQIATYDSPPMAVIKVEDAGEQDTYDVSMGPPGFNFVANGVVVHNCYKTSSGLWLAEDFVNEARVRNLLPGPKIPTGEAPSILIITSKGGKGTYLEAIPEILPDYTIINVETQALYYYLDGHMLKLDKKVKFVPPAFGMPTVCLAHYPIFARSNFGKFETDERGLPIQLDGKFVFKDWLQSDYIAARKWDVIVCDEFHRLKDRDAKWTVTIKRIVARIAKHGMTGTGFINRPDEIWSLLHWLDPEAYPSYWDFRDDFCLIDDWDGQAKVVGCKPEKLQEFREIIRTIGVRRELSQVRPDIKVPLFKPETVELNKTQRRMYDALKRDLEAEDQKGTPLYSANVLSMLQRLRQICVATPEVIEDYYDEVEDRRIQRIKLVEPSSKLDSVMDILEDLQWDDDKKEPLVVFSNFKDPLELLKARLDKHNEFILDRDFPEDMLYKYIHLDVGDSDLERYRKWHDEFPKLEHRVFMSTLQLGGESINLTPAQHVVFLDRSWSPKDNAQGIGRVRRPGQEGQPVVIHINALNTTDQYIERVNDLKHGWFTQIFGRE